MAAILLVGFGKVDITPPLRIPYLSYYPRQTRFEGVHDRLYARTLALELTDADEGGRRHERAAIVAVDSLGISRRILGPERDFIAEIRDRVTQRTGIPAAHVLVAASHAHSTAQTTDIAPLVEACPAAHEWLERFADQLAAAVEIAWASRRPAEVRGATGLAPGIAWCRRIITTDGRIVRLQQRPADEQVVKEPRDDRVPVLLVSDAETPPGQGSHGACGPSRGTAHRRGAVIGFTCHPTTVQVQPLVSADYPGVACAIVERELGADACLFLQGACGNVGPVRATTDFQDVALYGRALAGEALRALSLLEARDVPPMRPALAVASEVVELERRPLPDREPLERQARRLEAAIGAAASDDERRKAIAAFRKVAEPLQLARLGSGPVRMEVQALRIGNALIVACEGELFVEYGHRIKDLSPAAVTFVAAYANGYEGYIPTPESWDEGGYEPSLGPWTRVSKMAGETLIDRMAAVARRVMSEE